MERVQDWAIKISDARRQEMQKYYEMSDEEFDERIAAGLSQAQEDMGSTVAETFARLRPRTKNEREAI